MKLLKRILFILLGIIILLLIVALFVPKDFKAEAQIIINKPEQEVFNYVKYIKNQDNYGKWQLMDPGMDKSYEGTDGTVGFIYKWDSKELGKGSQKITKVTEGEKIETELFFGFGDPAHSYLITEDLGGNKTKIIWGITGRSVYPFNLMHLFFNMDSDFEEGLNTLKKVLEKQ